MSTYEHQIEIEAPIDYVFAWGIDPENWQRAMPALTETELIETTDDGERYRVTFNILGRSLSGESVFQIIEPNAHTVSVMEGSALTEETHYNYTETDTGTNLRFVAEFEDAKSLFDRAVQPVFKRYMTRQYRNHLQTTKELVEAEYAVETVGVPQ